MSTWHWIVAIVAGWCVLAVLVGLIFGPIFKRNRRRYPKPPHIEPPAHPEVQIPEQRQGPKPRRRPQQWPYKNIT